MTKIVCIIAFLLSLNVVYAQKKTAGHERYLQPGDKPLYTLMNINRLSMWISCTGITSHSPKTMEGAHYPRGTVHVVYIDGLTWGGYSEDTNPQNPRVGGSWYNTALTPGHIIEPGDGISKPPIAADPSDSDVRIYRIRPGFDSLEEYDLLQDAAEFYEKEWENVSRDDMNFILNQYETDWQQWPVEHGAPFYDLNANGLYEPQAGETPGLAGADQVIWFACNDLDQSKTIGIVDSEPLGLELQVTVWGYDRVDWAGQMIFKRYRLINKSGFTIDSMFVGQWSDPDIGRYTDDYAGCDPDLDLIFAYNGFPDDEMYGWYSLAPAAVGYILLQGPSIQSPGDKAYYDFNFIQDYKNLHSTSASFVPPDFVPSPADYEVHFYELYYNRLNGLQHAEQPTSVLHRAGPLKGQPTKFPLDGDPVRGTGDLDGMEDNFPPGDRTMLLSSGAFTLQSGETQEIVIALVGGLGQSHIGSVSILKHYTRRAHYLHKNSYRFPQPVPVPSLIASSAEGTIVLDWGSDIKQTQQVESDDPDTDYRFEGYNVWQLPPDSLWEERIRLATFDLSAPPGAISAQRIDPETDLEVTVPVIYGMNSGIERYLVLDRDYIANTSFISGRSYTYAVTAYRYSPSQENPDPVLESEPAIITVTAQGDNPGFSSRSGDTLQVIHTEGISTTRVQARVANPALVTGHTYEIRFDDSHKWSVYDRDLQQVLVSGLHSQVLNGLSYIIDGINITVEAALDSGVQCHVSGIHWVGMVNWDNYGSAIPGDCSLLAYDPWIGPPFLRQDLFSVQIHFQDSLDVLRNGYISRGAVYRRDLGYAYAGTGELPFAAFDISDEKNPRRLNICFVEDNNESMANGTTANMIWDMGWNPDSMKFANLGGREYIFINKSDYDEGSLYNATNDGTVVDVLFTWWSENRGNLSYLNSAYDLFILIDRLPVAGDVYTFTAPSASRIPNRYQLYPVYPNPFNNEITFRYWLPGIVIVRLEIYNTTGQKITTLINKEQNRGEYFYRWLAGDLASGIYLYRFRAGENVDTGKMVLVK